jgi:magnesium transporter
MITFWQQENGKFIHKEQEELDTNSPLWVDARNVNREDMRILEEDFHIQQEHILDILDQDEMSRIEPDDDYTLFIFRLPIFNPENDVNYLTVPLGIVFLSIVLAPFVPLLPCKSVPKCHPFRVLVLVEIVSIRQA